MRVRAWIALGLGLLLAFGAGCKDEESEAASDEPAAEPADEAAPGGTDGSESQSTSSAKKKGPAFDMGALQFALAPPWTSEYDRFLQSWAWSKVPDPKKPPVARFYIGKMPPAVPRTVDHYASKLQHEPSFQDSGYVYTSVDRKEILDDGWVIVGKEKNTLDAAAEPRPGLVVYRNIGGKEIRCRGGNITDPKDLELIVAACRAANF